MHKAARALALVSLLTFTLPAFAGDAADNGSCP